MDFRFALIPAGSADSDAQAQRIAAVMRGAPEQEPDSAITEVLGALEGSPVGHYVEGCRHTGCGALLAADRPESGLLEALLILTKDHGLAVYDIELRRLYDPSGSIEVDVMLPGVRIPFLTRDLLTDLVLHPEWPEPEAPYLIVERAEQDFIQAWLDDDGTYQFEYREDGPESHFVVHTGDAALVIDVMWAWAIGDPSWRTAVDWQFVDVEAADRATAETTTGSVPVKRESRSASLQNEHRADGSRLHVDAQLDGDGTLRITGHDLGPITSMMSDDGEYEWFYTVEPQHVPALVVALGGQADEDVIDLLEHNYSDRAVSGLGAAISASGVPYGFYSYP